MSKKKPKNRKQKNKKPKNKKPKKLAQNKPALSQNQPKLTFEMQGNILTRVNLMFSKQAFLGLFADDIHLQKIIEKTSHPLFDLLLKVNRYCFGDGTWIYTYEQIVSLSQYFEEQDLEYLLDLLKTISLIQDPFILEWKLETATEWPLKRQLTLPSGKEVLLNSSEMQVVFALFYLQKGQASFTSIAHLLQSYIVLDSELSRQESRLLRNIMSSFLKLKRPSPRYAGKSFQRLETFFLNHEEKFERSSLYKIFLLICKQILLRFDPKSIENLSKHKIYPKICQHVFALPYWLTDIEKNQEDPLQKVHLQKSSSALLLKTLENYSDLSQASYEDKLKYQLVKTRLYFELEKSSSSSHEYGKKFFSSMLLLIDFLKNGVPPKSKKLATKVLHNVFLFYLNCCKSLGEYKDSYQCSEKFYKLMPNDYRLAILMFTGACLFNKKIMLTLASTDVKKYTHIHPDFFLIGLSQLSQKNHGYNEFFHLFYEPITKETKKQVLVHIFAYFFAEGSSYKNRKFYWSLLLKFCFPRKNFLFSEILRRYLLENIIYRVSCTDNFPRPYVF